jgi:hypothetical protein
VALDDAAGQHQPEPGALTVGLGREERVEDPRADLARNSRAAVGDLDSHALLRRVVARPETQAAWRHRILNRLTRVRDQVHHHLLELVCVGHTSGRSFWRSKLTSTFAMRSSQAKSSTASLSR